MEPTKRPFASIEGDNVVIRVGGEIVFKMPGETIAATFDQARESLEELLGDLDDGIRQELGTGGVSGATLVRARQALAAMEATS